MKRFLPYIILLVMTWALGACDKAPSHVIGESDMVDLLVDIHEAEALIDMYPDRFRDDSAKKVLKKSVLMKHHVTEAKLDTSMVWYSRNMAVYVDVYDRVIKKLEKNRNDLDVKSGMVVAARNRKANVRSYKDYGDTADIWQAGRQLVLNSSIGKNIFPFIYASNQETQPGDKYLLQLKMLNNRAALKVLIGVEYIDGAVSFIERPSTREGWNEFVVQADTLRKIKNVYGYVKFNVSSKSTVCYVDSIMLLRVHLDRKTYGVISMQRDLDRNKKTENDSKVAELKNNKEQIKNTIDKPVELKAEDKDVLNNRTSRHSNLRKRSDIKLTQPQKSD
ncbi:MAG: DUF4296 domain-containing protein [Muribaculaceae bacterium]